MRLDVRVWMRPALWRQLGTGFGTLLPAWLGVYLLAMAWMRTVHFATLPAPHTVWWFVAGAALLVAGCAAAGSQPRRLGRFDGIALAIAALAAMWALPRPYAAGPGLLAAAAAVSLLPRPRALHGLVSGLWTAGVVMTLQAALVPLLFIVFSRLHEAPFLAPFIYWPLKLLAPETLHSGAVITMMTSVDAIELTPAWEKLGAIPAALAFAGFAVVLLQQPQGRARGLGCLAVSLLYGWIRLVVLFLVVSRFKDARVFWDFFLVFSSFLPWPFVLAAWWRSGDRTAPGPVVNQVRSTVPRGKSLVRGGALAALAGGLLVGGTTLFWGFSDPGFRKAGRVLIDESHSDWEWTTQPFDVAWYGSKAGYNYYCLADYLNYFYHVESHRDRLTPQWLSRWDVVVLKTPTAAYSREEIDALEDFVRRGGGLWLIGDHTNVFGSSTYLNPIAERFGLYFRYDATYDLRTLDLSLWQPPAILPHPVVRGIDRFLFATSCSLDSPLLSDNVMLGYGLRSMYLDYSEMSYFPTKEGKNDYLFPLLVQSAGVRCGKGRVLGFTDSTTLSNFFMFIPGKPELALGSIDWLNRSNRAGSVRWLALAASLAGLGVLGLAVRRGMRPADVTLLVASGLLTFVLVGRACDRAAARSYAPPASRRPVQEVVFDGQSGNFLLPITSLLGNTWNNMHTFFVWVQRLGLVPRWSADLRAALATAPRVLVEVNPRRLLATDETDAIVDFVRRGGHLVVLDTPENEGSTANALLGAFGMSFVPMPGENIAILRPASPAGDWLQGTAPGDTLWTVTHANSVTGGRTLLQLPNGGSVMSVHELGKGKVIAMGASRLFSSEVFGNTAVEPNARMRRVYQIQYDLFERILDLHVPDRYATGAPSPSPSPR